MRKINKQSPYPKFTQFVGKYKPIVWEDFDKHPQSSIRQESKLYILTTEQDCMCGYTELPIDEQNSHIDHYVKRSIDHTKIFDWNNLIVASIDDDFGAKYKDNGYKIKANDYASIFNPVVDNMEDYVYYANDGEMRPNNKCDDKMVSKVNKTIEVFNLNIRSLKDRRKEIITNINTYRKSGLSEADIRAALASIGFVSVVDFELARPIINNQV